MAQGKYHPKCVPKVGTKRWAWHYQARARLTLLAPDDRDWSVAIFPGLQIPCRAGVTHRGKMGPEKVWRRGDISLVRKALEVFARISNCFFCRSHLYPIQLRRSLKQVFIFPPSLPFLHILVRRGRLLVLRARTTREGLQLEKILTASDRSNVQLFEQCLIICSSFYLKYVNKPIKDSPRLLSFINQLNIQCSALWLDKGKMENLYRSGPGPGHSSSIWLVPVPIISGLDDWSRSRFIFFLPVLVLVPILVPWLGYWNIHIKNAQKY